jgi:hypothetical protein
MAASRLIPVRVGDIDIGVEVVPVVGTEPTASRTGHAAEHVADAFTRAQDTILEIAKTTAHTINKAGAAVRPDHLEVEFGLKFSATGGVILAGATGEASLKVTLSYDTTRPTPPAGDPS